MLITAIFILCFMSAVTAIPCKDVNLQSDVDYTKVKGEWWQARHSHESRYSEFSCFDTRIFGVNTEHKLFYMQEVASETRPRIGTVQLLLMSTMCWGSCVSEREVNIEGRLATDYDNYLIIYQCDEKNQAVIDLELKKGVDALSVEKINEVDQIIKKIGMDYWSLAERNRGNCPSPKR
uniref:uncharacterized protein LOC120334145 n=1 Tax=Styela clava TaxID=7725 RepID=UPI0019395E01|nr:uncharacterized protein LOC120334145 [Styela clava]